MEIIIDEEFRSLIPPLSAEERQQLETNLIAEGCRDSLVLGVIEPKHQHCKYCYTDDAEVRVDIDEDVITCTKCDHNIGRPEYILLDGHNRYEICEELNIDYKTTTLEFKNRTDAKIWIIKNQFGRRNIIDAVKCALALKLKPLIAAQAKEKQKEHGGTAPGKKSLKQKSAKVNTREELAKVADVSHDTIAKVDKVLKVGDKKTKEKMLSGEISINAAHKEIKKAERKKEIESQKKEIKENGTGTPEGLFDVIVMDPPWAYGREYDPEGSRVANPYPEMSQSELLKLEPPAADDSALFLWTTHAFIFDAKELLEHWGFEYKATMVWDKEKIGMGAWLRMQCEFCLVGIKGKPFWDNTKHRDIMREKRRQHSRKPEVFYTIVEEITAGRRIEYFARQSREGWEVIGNDTEKF